MNTLSRQVTARFYINELDYNTLRQHWGQLVRSEKKYHLKAVHYLLYQVLRGKDWRKAFSFPTNLNKLKNGYTAELYRALDQMAFPLSEPFVLAPFNGLVTHETLEEVRKQLHHVLRVRPLNNTDGSYRCEAYSAPLMAMKEG